MNEIFALLLIFAFFGLAFLLVAAFGRLLEG